jgi:hypothetical protein
VTIIKTSLLQLPTGGLGGWTYIIAAIFAVVAHVALLHVTAPLHAVIPLGLFDDNPGVQRLLTVTSIPMLLTLTSTRTSMLTLLLALSEPVSPRCPA